MPRKPAPRAAPEAPPDPTKKGARYGPWAIETYIARGTFTAVCVAADVHSGVHCALKIAVRNEAGQDAMVAEAKYLKVTGDAGITPALMRGSGQSEDRWFYETPTHYYMAIQLLGDAAAVRLNDLGDGLGTCPAWALADFAAQGLRLLRQLHRLGIMHRDVKPQNFCYGRGGDRNRLYVIDFNLSEPEATCYSQNGTAYTMSLNQELGGRCERMDDYISVVYGMCAFHATLPWYNLNTYGKQVSDERVRLKQNTPVAALTLGMPPALAAAVAAVLNQPRNAALPHWVDAEFVAVAKGGPTPLDYAVPTARAPNRALLKPDGSNYAEVMALMRPVGFVARVMASAARRAYKGAQWVAHATVDALGYVASSAAAWMASPRGAAPPLKFAGVPPRAAPAARSATGPQPSTAVFLHKYVQRVQEQGGPPPEVAAKQAAARARRAARRAMRA